MAGFDKVASVYDRLAHIVFGKTLLKSKLHFLEQIQIEANVLIIGGGTGEILPFLPERCIITFMEPSAKMIEVARKRRMPIQTAFVESTLEEFESDYQFDVIIANFFFDLFEEPELSEQIEKVKSLLASTGKLIVTDFSYGSWWHQIWQRPLVAAMYLFFRFTAGLKTRRLPNIEKEFKEVGLRLQLKRHWAKGFVWSGVISMKQS